MTCPQSIWPIFRSCKCWLEFRLQPPEFNCSIFVSRKSSVSEHCDHPLRNWSVLIVLLFVLSWFSINPNSFMNWNARRRRQRERRWSQLCLSLYCRLVRSSSWSFHNSGFLSYKLPCACWIVLIVTKSSCFLCHIPHECVKSVRNCNPRMRSISW